MTELEWLKQESGLTDDELKTYETILGDAKFKTMLKKVIDANTALSAAKTKAEGELQQFTSRYNDEFVPALRDAAQQAIDADAKRAAAEAKLAKAKELGIVIGDDDAQSRQQSSQRQGEQPPRAPGSPDPNAITRDDFSRFSNAQSNTIMALQDLNAEHFSLFNAPLGGTQELVAEVNRQHLLGNKGFTLKNAWETKFNVAAKREEIAAAAKQKEKDEWTKEVLRQERERNGANPHTRSGKPSRYDRYRSSDAGKEATKPWQSSHNPRERNTDWRNQALAKVRDAQAA
jgi:hypothetical protein